MTRTPPPTNWHKKFPAEPLTPAEVRSLIAAASNRSTSGIRLRAMIAVLYGAGLRVSEMLDLALRDVDTTNCSVRVREGKGRKARVVKLQPEACALLDLWIARRSSLGLNGRQPLFCGYSSNAFGSPIDQRTVRRDVAKLGVKAGIEKRVHPHGLRHSLAFGLVEQGMPLHVISGQLGHSSTATTDTYLRKLTPAELGRHLAGVDLLADED